PVTPLSILHPPPRPPLFPYTTLFRSSRPCDAVAPAPLARTARRHDGFFFRGGLDAIHVFSTTQMVTSFGAELLFGGTPWAGARPDRKSTRLNSSHLGISYAVFCLKKK